MNDIPIVSLSERKAWAMQRGNPLWLWPEIAPDQWREAMAQIERACVAVLAGDCPDALRGDAAAFELAGYTSGMGPMLGWWLEKGLIPKGCDAVESTLCRQLHANGARMDKLLEHTRGLVQLLSDNCIGVTVLKGVHTAFAYFPSPACRPMSDVDILVGPDDAARSEGLLQGAQYRPVARNPLETTWRHADAAACPETLVSLEADDPWTLDLHVSLDVEGPPGALPARLSRLDQTENREPWELFGSASKLTQPGLLLHLAAHAGSGFHNLTMVRLLELALVARIDQASGALDWNDFMEVGQSTGGLAFAYPALELARCLAPDDIAQSVVERCKAEAPAAVRGLVGGMSPATSHRIDGPSLREHFAWTRGAIGWLRRLAADIVPDSRSLRRTAAVHAARARGLLRIASRLRVTRRAP